MSTTDAVSVMLVEKQSELAETMVVGVFLAGSCGATRRSYARDLRLFSMVPQGQPEPVHRRAGPLELFGRWMEETGRMPWRSPGDSPPWRTSTAIANKRVSWITTRR
jgi:hypothetical protein